MKKAFLVLGLIAAAGLAGACHHYSYAGTPGATTYAQPAPTGPMPAPMTAPPMSAPAAGTGCGGPHGCG